MNTETVSSTPNNPRGKRSGRHHGLEAVSLPPLSGAANGQRGLKLFNSASLARGAMLLDCAFAHGRPRLDLSLADYIGLVAAYIGTGRYTVHMEEDLAEHLDHEIAEKAQAVLIFFNGWNGKGLWEQGPAMDHIKFTDPTLDKMYPAVNQAFKKNFW